MKNELNKKSLGMFWVLFLFFNLVGLHALYVGRIKEFLVRIVITMGVYMITFAESFYSISIGDFSGDFMNSLVLNVPLDPFIFRIVPTVISYLQILLIVLAVIDFFRIILGKYIPKEAGLKR